MTTTAELSKLNKAQMIARIHAAETAVAEAEARVSALKERLGEDVDPWTPTTVESAVRAALAKLVIAPESVESALGSLAVEVAKKIDDGVGMALAGVSKELRETLDSIALACSAHGVEDPFADVDAELEAARG